MQRGLSFWIGLSFIVLGVLSSAAAVLQYRKVLQTLQPIEIPSGYFVNLSALTSMVVAALGAALSAYLFRGVFF